MSAVFNELNIVIDNQSFLLGICAGILMLLVASVIATALDRWAR